MTKAITQQQAYRLDMSQTLEDGSFLCPHCDSKISPDDRTESNYIIYETKMRKNSIDAVIITCKRCLSLTHLVVDEEIGQLEDTQDCLL